MIALRIAEQLAEELEEVPEERLLMAAHRVVNNSQELWTSVAERFPCRGDTVLACGIKGGVFMGAVWSAGPNEDGTVWIRTANGMRRARGWMPCPEGKGEQDD